MTRAGRTARWTAVAVLFLTLLWVGWRAGERFALSAPEYAANRLVLTILTLAIVVLALGFAGILVRNLVRLVLDRKRGILGSRLRTKMVFFFLALLLLPALLLSYGAAAFIKSSVDALLRTPVEDVVRQTGLIVKEAGRREEARALATARAAVREFAPGRSAESATGEELHARLEEFANGHAVDLIVLVARTAEGAAVGPLRAVEARARDAEASARELAASVRSSGEAVFRVAEVEGGFVLEAGAPWPASIPPGAEADGAAVVSTFVNREAATRLEAVNRAREAYDRFRVERRELLRLYYVLISLVGLGTMFAATWIGFTVARRITAPIQETAAAAREISSGNLAVRVGAKVGDEVGLLVEAFNDMAAQLQESREVITRSTADLRRTNRALDDRRRFIETLIAGLSIGVVSVDPEGRITASNPAAERILSVPLAHGDAFENRLAMIDPPSIGEALRAATSTPVESRRADVECFRAGSPVALSVQVAPLQGARGEDLGTLLMVEDLTELLRAQKAAAWREVARRIAHEIKNPLTPIQLSAQRLRRKFEDRSPDLEDVVRTSTAGIEAEVGNLKRLVDEFSRYARLPEPVLQWVDMREVVRSVRSLYAGHQSIRWEEDLDTALAPVRVDPEQMRRVVTNLVDNAVEATNGQGWIRIALRRTEGPGSLRLEVEDDGPGVPLAQRPRLFEPYFSTKRKGTGLGLAIVERIVAEHGGSIRVEDGSRGGLRFVVEIPIEAHRAA